MLERIQKYRRDLHQIPELELELPKTQRYLQEALRDLPCTLSSPIPSSVVAFFDAGKKESIAFRSDMDALPVTEATGRAFASRHTGCMHACGLTVTWQFCWSSHTSCLRIIKSFHTTWY